jgi:hypothetical protein
MRHFSAILAITGIFVFCTGLGRNGGSPSDGPVDFSVILSGPYSSAESFQVLLVTNERDWDDIWQKTKGREQPLPSKPSVNFDSQYVIAAFMGQRTSSGYKIEIDSVEKKGRSLKVHVKKYETPGMLTVMTQPFTLVRVPRGHYKLEVIEETVQ